MHCVWTKVADHLPRHVAGCTPGRFLLEESAPRAQVADAEVMSRQLGSLLHARLQHILAAAELAQRAATPRNP